MDGRRRAGNPRLSPPGASTHHGHHNRARPCEKSAHHASPPVRLMKRLDGWRTGHRAGRVRDRRHAPPLLGPDLPPIAAASPPAAAPLISAMIRNFLPPPLVAPARMALICAMVALAVCP